MKRALVSTFIAILLTGCTNETFEKAMDQGKLSLAAGEYEIALASFELALREEPENKEAKSYQEKLVKVGVIKEAIENTEWEEALKQANSLLKDKTIESNVKTDLEEYVKTAETSIENNKAVSNNIEDIKSLVEQKKYHNAQVAINKLKQDVKLKSELGNFSNEFSALEETVNTELRKIKEAEIAEAKKIAEEAKAAAEKAEAEAKQAAQYDPWEWSPGVKAEFENQMVQNGYADSADTIQYKKSHIANNCGFYEVYATWDGEHRYIVVVNVKTGWYHG